MPGPRSTVSFWARRRAFQIAIMSFQLDRYTVGADRVDGWVRTMVSPPVQDQVIQFVATGRLPSGCLFRGGSADSKPKGEPVPARAHDSAWACLLYTSPSPR